MPFKLNDVTEGETVLRGTALDYGKGRVTREGLVTKILRGHGFAVDDGTQQSILVRDCRILEGEEAATIKAMVAAAVGRPRRSDRTLKRGEPLMGIVDHVWWDQQCVSPDFAVFGEYTDSEDIDTLLNHECESWHPNSVGGRAWRRQWISQGDNMLRSSAECVAAAYTPPAAVRTLTPPLAPSRLETARPPALNLEGLLAAADDNRLPAPRASDSVTPQRPTTSTPTYSVSDDDDSDTTPLREAPPLSDSDTCTRPVTLLFPPWFLMAIVGILVLYMWTVVAFVSRTACRAPVFS